MNDPLATANAAGSLESPSPALTSTVPASAIGSAADPDGIVTGSLPAEHPLWQRDALAVSARVRAILAMLRPAVVQVLSFWDHVARSIRIGTATIEIDPSGSYRRR